MDATKNRKKRKREDVGAWRRNGRAKEYDGTRWVASTVEL